MLVPPRCYLQEIILNEHQDDLERLWNDQTNLPNSATGRQFGQYKIVEVTGVGAFEIVFRTMDVQTGQSVALKVSRIEVLIHREKLDGPVPICLAKNNVSFRQDQLTRLPGCREVASVRATTIDGHAIR